MRAGIYVEVKAKYVYSAPRVKGLSYVLLLKCKHAVVTAGTVVPKRARCELCTREARKAPARPTSIAEKKLQREVKKLRNELAALRAPKNSVAS